MKPFFKTSIVTLLIAASTLGMSQRAAASTTVVYTVDGHSCFSTFSFNSALNYTSQYGIYESKNVAEDVYCPITTDNQPWTQLFFEVDGYNRNAQDPLNCTLLVGDQFGNLLPGSPMTVSLPTAQAAFQSNFTFRTSTAPQGYTNLGIRCHMPAGVLNGPTSGPTTFSFSHVVHLIVSKVE